MVIETPPNVLGIIDDHWFHYVTDFGNAGPDKGKGGKFLILPPGYEGEVPDGYHVARTHTYGNWVIWRGFQVDGSTAPAVEATKKIFRVYPLSQADNPPKMNFINVSGVFHNTIHRMDYGIFEEINEVVQAEPAEGQSAELLGLLASIGIHKGQPFAPDARMKKILTEAADVGAATVRTLAARPREDGFYFYPGEGVWTTPFPGGSHEFLDDGAVMLDARAFFHFYATGITPAMTSKMVGKGSQYAVAYMDARRQCPSMAARPTRCTCRRTCRPRTSGPSRSTTTRPAPCCRPTSSSRVSSSIDEGLQQNADGSFDVYFGPEAPGGQGSQLDPDRSRQGLEHALPPLRSARSPGSTRPGGPVTPSVVE